VLVRTDAVEHTSLAASQIADLSSPRSDSSMMMSHPPRSSPATYSCGYVGQSEYSFRPCRTYTQVRPPQPGEAIRARHLKRTVTMHCATDEVLAPARPGNVSDRPMRCPSFCLRKDRKLVQGTQGCAHGSHMLHVAQQSAYPGVFLLSEAGLSCSDAPALHLML
jgi:hypothetical protein